MFISSLDSLNEFDSCPWVDFKDYDWSCLINNQLTITFKKNEIIYHQQDISDFVYLVHKGRVCLYTLSDLGEEKSFFIAEAGCIFGEISVIDNRPNTCYAMAVTDTHVYKIPKNTFLKELTYNVEFSNMVLKLVVKKTKLLLSQLKQLSFNDANYRVYSSILHLVNNYSTPSKSGYELTIKFTHQEMANLTGLSRVSVSQIISNLTKDGILQKEKGYYIVRNLESIVQYITGDTI
jgi:CRP-like cAMP-binding protein